MADVLLVVVAVTFFALATLYVTACGSGLDPHISVRNAELQAPRVAGARGLPLEAVLALVDVHTSSRDLGFLGERGVKVLELNLDVDRQE